MSDPEERLRALGIELAEPAGRPRHSFVGAVRVGTILFVSGHAGFRDGKPRFVGKLGRDYDVAQGKAIAREVILASLGTVRATLGDLRKVRRVVKLLGMVNSAPGFVEQPAVVDGASELLVEIFGESGRHARSAIGVSELAQGSAVEIEMVLEVEA